MDMASRAAGYLEIYLLKKQQKKFNCHLAFLDMLGIVLPVYIFYIIITSLTCGDC